MAEAAAETAAVPMVEVWRGNIPESHHRGHAVICDAKGEIRAAWGDPEAVILPRSSCKMLQALPLVESGAADGLSSERLALACASHNGAAMHVERVARWLADLGIGEPDLRCGPQVPDDAAERNRLRAAGEAPCQLHNNCSGKHAGFLTLNRHLGGGTEYVEIDHPVQRAVRAAFEEMCGAESPGWGVDGCSAPNFATTVHGLARAMARMADPRGPRPGARGGGAAAGGGDDRPSAARGRRGARLLRARWRRWTGSRSRPARRRSSSPSCRARGLGVALKIEDGATRASECAIAALLARLGAIAAENPAAARRLRPPVLSRRGFPAGRIQPDAAFWAGGAPI